MSDMYAISLFMPQVGVFSSDSAGFTGLEH
jgi:hypothetical protein